MKKKLIVTIILAFMAAIALSFFFSKTIKLALVKYYVSETLGNVHYENARIDDLGKIQIAGLSMQGHSMPKGIDLFIPQCEIDVGISTWPLSLKLDLSLYSPVLSLNEALSIEKIAARFDKKRQFFDTETSLNIDNGKVCLEGRALLVEGNIDFVDLLKSRVLIKDGDGRNTFRLSYEGSKDVDETLLLNCKDFDIASLFNVLGPWVPKLQGLKMLSGSLDGDLRLIKDRSKFQEVKGSLELKNLFFESLNGELQAKIPLCHFEADFQKRAPKIVIGKGTFLNDIELTLHPVGGGPYVFVIKEGSFSLETIKALNYQFMGKSTHNGLAMPFVGTGSINLFHPGKEAFSLELGFIYHQNGQAKADVSLKELGRGWKGISLGLGNITKEEFSFFKDFSVYFPGLLPQIDFQDGFVNGLIKAHIHGNTIKDVSIDHLHFIDSTLNLNDLGLLLKAKKVTVRGGLNLFAKASTDCMSVLVDVIDGHVEGTVPFNYVVNKSYAEVALENGVLKKIKASGFFQDIESAIDYDATNNYGAFIKLRCQAKCLENFIPTNLKKAVQSNFLDDTLSIESALKETDGKYELRGKLDILSANNQKVAGGKFGLKAKVLTKENVRAFPIEEGWLFFENLDMERFVAPLIFLDAMGDRIPIELKGTATVQGKFENDGLMLSYDAKDVVMESDDFVIEVDRVYQKEIFKGNLTPANHFFSFKEGTHFGEIPIHHGTYKDKFSSLEFHDISCKVLLDNQKIRVQEVETISCGINFQADIEIDCTIQEIGAFDVTVVTKKISGRAADLKNFALHLNSGSYISYIPLDGEIRSGLDDCQFKFKVRDLGTEVFTKIKGSLFEGSLPIENRNAVFKEFGFFLSYESFGKLDISSIQGTLIIGGLKKPREYFLNSHGISIDNLSTGDGKFDLWMEGEGHELFHLMGVSKGRKAGSDLYVDILPDTEKTHFLGIHPEDFQLVMDHLEKVKLFSFAIGVDLSHASKGIQESVSKLSSLFAFEKNEEQNGALQGELKLKINYSDVLDALTFQTHFKHLKIGDKEFKEAEIEGHYRNKTFFIDSFLFDDLSFAAEVSKEDAFWNIRFLGGSIKDKVTFGIEGLVDENSLEIVGKIRRFEANPAFLELFNNDERLDLNRFQGSLVGNGDFRLQKGLENGFDFNLEMLLDGKLRIDNVNLLEIKPFSLSWTKTKGVSVRDFEADLYPINQEAKSGTLKLGKEVLYSSDKKLILNNVTFSLLPKAIKPVFNMLGPWLPLLKEDRLQQMLTDGTDPYVGILSLAKDTYFLSLQERKITLFDTPRVFRNFSCEINRDHFRLLADFSLGSKWIRARAVSKDPAKNQGSIEFSDPLDGTDNKIEIAWKKDNDFSFEILKVKGALAGFTIDLNAYDYTTDYYMLQGTVSINTAKVAPYNNDSIFFKESLSSILRGNFKLAGTFKVSKKEFSELQLDGKLNASQVLIKDIFVSHIESDISGNNETLIFQNMQIVDPAGKANIPEMQVFLGLEKIHIPLLQAASIRPAILRTTSGLVPIKNKALKISDLEISNLSFSIRESADIKATGWLKFSNTSKTLLQNTLFQIPREIVTRLGLNPSVLTPVKGEIFFEFGSSKIFITKLKDVFSEGKGSKFYLASKTTPSYIDYDGNMMIQIRMKQYNILFKLAELFTVTVKGNYQKPLYFLQKQE